MRNLHRLRMLRRSRNFNPLAIFTIAKKSKEVAKVVKDLKKTPEQLNRIGDAAQSITDANLAERIGSTAEELTQTARWVKYAAIGGLGLGGLLVMKRTLSRT